MDFPMWPQFAEKTLSEVAGPLRSGRVNYWTGSKGMEFEKKWSKWLGVRFAISCVNGTAALHIALSGFNIGPGDEVIVPSYSFIASSFSIIQAGAIPVFCDVSTDHTIDPEKIEPLISEKTKAIIVVHLYGVVADMDPILALARKHNLKVIEDCAQCFGGEYNGKKTGTVGDAGCFSFCQSKHFTTGGEGGMVTTDSEDFAWEFRSFRDHGYDVKERLNLLALEEKLPYIHNRVGFNYRMTEIQSIIGINELERFDNWNLKRRRYYASLYDEKLKDRKGIKEVALNTEERKNAYWWYPFLLDLKVLDCDSETFRKRLTEEGVPNYGIQWPEAYLEKAYVEKNGFGTVKFPFLSKEYSRPIDYSKVFCETAHNLRAETVNLFLHPTWEREHIDFCINGVITVLESHYK